MSDPNATPPYDPAAGQPGQPQQPQQPQQPTPPPYGQQPTPPAYGAPQQPQPGQQPYGAQPGQPYQPGAVAAPPLTPADDKLWASLGHFGGILGWIPPLIIWLIFKDRGPLTNQEAKESLNFQITVSIFTVGLFILGTILTFVFIGLLILPLAYAVQIVGVIFAIIAGVKVNGGGTYRYFFAFRFIK
jgi:uncharacterized Tic20 family protein